MKKLILSLFAIGLASSTAAMAHGWDHHDGWRERQWRAAWNGGSYVHDVCSGRRADGLENRLRHEVNQGDIEPWRARQINQAIDNLEDRQRGECRQGDWGDVRGIARQYDRISDWIDRESRQRRW